MIYKVITSLVIAAATAYPFVFDTQRSLIENLGFIKITDNENKAHHRYLDTAIAVIKKERANAHQQEATIRFLASRVHQQSQQITLLSHRLGKFQKQTEQLITANAQNLIESLLPLGPVLEKTKVTSRYGYRKHPITGKRKHHNGIDFRAPIGTPIYAPANGVVREILKPSQSKGSGLHLKIDHGYGFTSSYSHLNKIHAKSEGLIIRKGDIIAFSGNSGRSTGPHLHYEIKYLGKAINPLPMVRFNEHGSINTLSRQQRKVNWKAIYAQLVASSDIE